MDARSLVMGYAAARTVTDDPQTLNQSAILGAVMDGRPIFSFVVAQQYARSVTPATTQTSSPASTTPTTLPPPGTGTVTVPDLSKAGDENAMRKLLRPLSLLLHVRREVHEDHPNAGDFMSQSPLAGDPAPQNSTVTVVLSREWKGTNVPDVGKHTKLAAVQDPLLQAWIHVRVEPVRDGEGDFENGDVVDVSPPSGTTVHHGDTVTIYVWEGRRLADHVAPARAGRASG